MKLFHAQGYRMGRLAAAKIITYAKTILLPDAELIAIRTELLQHDWALLEEVECHLAKLEECLVALGAQTPYQVLIKLKSLAAVQVASLAAAIGDPSHYQLAGQVFHRAGLVCGRDDSGTRRRKGKGKQVVQVGDVYLRRALMTALATLILHQPVLRTYYTRLKKSKPDGVARVATARRAIGLLWAALCDQRPTMLSLKRGARLCPQVAQNRGRVIARTDIQ